MDTSVPYQTATPVRSDFLSFGTPSLDGRESVALVDVLNSRWLTQGEVTLAFERAIAEYVGAKEALFVNSCTAGLHLSLIAAGVRPGDEVITTPMTFVATVNVIEHCGGVPVFADVDPATLNITPESVARAVTSKTKAVLGVHFGGRPFDIEGIRKVIPADVAIVEDAAHALGASYPGGKRVGSSGNLVNFSFYANKNLTTGEGGMVVCNDRELADTMRVWRLHGLEVNAWNRYASKAYHRSMASVPGFKYNSTNINAALGLAQLEKFPRFQERREQIAAMYDSLLSDVENVEIVPRLNAGGERHALHLYVVKLNLDALSAGRDEIVVALRQENIGVGVHYDAVHLHPFYANKYGWQPEDFPIAYDISQRVISLPGQPAMSDADVLSVVEGLRKVLAHYRR